MSLSAEKVTSSHWVIRNDDVGLVTHILDTEEPIIMADGQDLFILNKETSEFEPYTPPAE